MLGSVPSSPQVSHEQKQKRSSRGEARDERSLTAERGVENIEKACERKKTRAAVDFFGAPTCGRLKPSKDLRGERMNVNRKTEAQSQPQAGAPS